MYMFRNLYRTNQLAVETKAIIMRPLQNVSSNQGRTKLHIQCSCIHCECQTRGEEREQESWHCNSTECDEPVENSWDEFYHR